MQYSRGVAIVGDDYNYELVVAHTILETSMSTILKSKQKLESTVEVKRDVIDGSSQSLGRLEFYKGETNFLKQGGSLKLKLP